MNAFIRFHRFLNFNHIKDFFILMFLIIAFMKSSRNVTLVPFLKFFG